jgi:hypothetical protein
MDVELPTFTMTTIVPVSHVPANIMFAMMHPSVGQMYLRMIVDADAMVIFFASSVVLLYVPFAKK